jgi:hypothetical protein
MYDQLSLNDARKYQQLLAKQFNEVGRTLVLSNQETWELFLTQEESNEIPREHLPVIKSILLGRPNVPIDVFRDLAAERLKKYKYCSIMPVLLKMTNDEGLLPELVEHSLKMTAALLKPEAQRDRGV